MVKNYVKLAISKQNHDLLMNECVKEFLSHHPDFKGFTITRDFIITKLIEYYLK